MDGINMLISPIAGAIIGYFTNWLAIKMLFRPHTKKYIGKLHVPFTPGLIPKEKGRIASKLGKTVSDHLITENAFLDSLTSTEFTAKIEESLDDSFRVLKESPLSMAEQMETLLGKEKGQIIETVNFTVANIVTDYLKNSDIQLEITKFLNERIQVFLEKDLKSLPLEQYINYIKDFIMIEGREMVESGIINKPFEKVLWDNLLKLKEDERQLNELIPYSSIQGIKDYISIKTPVIVKGLLEIADNPEMEEKLKAKLDMLIRNFMGAFLGMLVNTDNLYEKLIRGIRDYFENIENQSEIDEAVSTLVERAMELTLGNMAEIAVGELREVTLSNIVAALLHGLMEEKNSQAIAEKCLEYLQKSENKKLYELLEQLEPQYKKRIYNTLENIVLRLCDDKAIKLINESIQSKLLKAWNIKISKMVSSLGEHRYQKLRQFLLALYNNVVTKIAPGFLEAVNIPKIVEVQINNLEMKDTEELIFTIAERELKAITMIGGVLGFVIGFVPVLIQLL